MSNSTCCRAPKPGASRKRKKRCLKTNGTEAVTVRTRHGRFVLRRARLRDRATGEEVRRIGPTLSRPLRQQILYWVSRLSFGDVACLLEQVAGVRLLSEDSLWRLVQQEASALDAAQHQAIQQSACQLEPHYRSPAHESLYEASVPEFVVLTDGLGVKAQKPTRQRVGEPKQPKIEKRHETDVLILPAPDGSERILCEGVSGRWTLVEAARATLKRDWAGAQLSVVALTDGAKTIREDLSALFGLGVRVVLDWYHLKKRVYQQLSMAAHSMREREEWEQTALALLWRGKATAAKVFLGGRSARNRKALSDLLGYLDKHTTEIIDYERRQQAGKPIGSGRMEKCVDQVVGHRQKGKGMSWTKQGSRALALLKVAELNACSPLPRQPA